MGPARPLVGIGYRPPRRPWLVLRQLLGRLARASGYRLARPELRRVEGKLNVLMVFPWIQDAVATVGITNGMTRRALLVARYLAERGAAVRVCAPGHAASEQRWGDVTISALPASGTIPPLVLKLGARIAGFLSGSQGLRNWIDSHAWWLDSVYRAHLRAELRNADVILVEDPNLAELVLSERPRGRRVILTDHDCSWLSQSWYREGLGQGLLRRKELAVLRRCDAVVSVSDVDHKMFEGFGVRTHLVPNGIDTRIFDEGGAPGEARTALFVGTEWITNSAAALEIAFALAPRAPWMTFVIAGGCAGAFEDDARPPPPNVRVVGVIPDEELVRLYRESTYALIPLRRGSGLSLKAVEALAAGKVVVSSAVGVRGIPFRDGEHGRVEDDIERWPSILEALDGDPALRQRFAAAARVLGRTFDYRELYETYVRLMNPPPGPARARR